ncbi:MAG: tyrosine-type recombinase/integrase [Actinobacteria bacterium]|nr:tyrosine-type recombinase/integrase [Actinomycetota bacterium]
MPKSDIAKKIEPVKKIASIERVILFDIEIRNIEFYINNRDGKEIENFRDLIIFYLGISCGLRRQEIINLNWNDIEIDEEGRPYLKILQSKGRKSRIVYISENLFELLNKYKKISRKYIGALIRGDYGRRITKTSLQNIIKRIYRESGVYKKNLNIHSLRHTYAERQRKRGIDIATISVLLGHSRLDTTMTYFHVNREDLKRAVL